MKNKKIPSWPVEAKAGLALVLTSAIIVGGALIIGSNSSSNHVEPSDDIGMHTTSIPLSNTESMNPTTSEDGGEVNSKVETLCKPFTVNAACARYFYDMDDDASIRAQAIVPVPNKPSTYMKSVGVDYTYNKATFDVIAATSGVVEEKVYDSVYGNMVIIKHESGLETIYASLGTPLVNEGDKVKQGDKIATSGESLYTSGLGSSLHFEVLKDGIYLNPEKSYTLEVSKL